MPQQPKLVVAIGGSSGSLYAKVLLDRLQAIREQTAAIAVVMTDNAKFNWNWEIGGNAYEQYPFDFYDKKDFMAPFASGSARFGAMVVCPCSMGLIGRIASGISDDLITRAADVILKERRRLVLVPRETPYSLVHLRNMTALTEAGAVICPASPSFYSRPQTPEEIVGTVVDRVLDLIGLDAPGTYRWNENPVGP
jgi:4-hydroxy-3-polyprenylbenzoate decarboxylase